MLPLIFFLAALALPGHACPPAVSDDAIPSSYMQGVPTAADKLVTSEDSWYREHEKASWAFQNLSKILKVDPVSRGTGPISQLPYSNECILNAEYDGPDGASKPLLALLKTLGVDGFVALKHGQIVGEAYFNGMRPDTRHIAFSVTKSFVGVLAGVMVDRKLLDPAQHVTHYLPELSQTGFEGATVRDLLDMVAGTEWNKVRSDPASLVNVNAMAGGFIRAPADFPYRNTLEFLTSLHHAGEHGQRHVYNASQTEALAWIITRIGGQPWQRTLSREVWSRLGAERDALVAVDNYGHGFGTAGINLTLRDLARFGLMLQNRGSFNGSQIVSSSWVDAMVRGDDRVRAAWRASTERQRKPLTQFYKSQFRILDSDKGEFYASGHQGQKVYVDMAAGIVVALFSTQPDSDLVAFHVPLFRQIAASVSHHVAK